MALAHGDCIALTFIGRHDGRVFDTNVPEELEKLRPGAKAEETLLIVGQGMIVRGLDEALVGAEVGKTYTITLSPAQAFGIRKPELVKMVPLKLFTAKRVTPRPGMTLALDDTLVRIVAVSGGRVTVDFNNPLAGKDVAYTYTVTRLITDQTERARVALQAVFKFIPEHSVDERGVTVILPQALEHYITRAAPAFLKILGLPLLFKAKEPASPSSPATHAAQ